MDYLWYYVVAAVISIIVGLIFMGTGYHLFRALITILTFLIAGSLCYYFIIVYWPDCELWLAILISVVVAVILSFFSFVVYYLAIMLAGAAVGVLVFAFVVLLVSEWVSIDLEDQSETVQAIFLASLSISVVFFAIVALVFAKFVIIVTTSMFGGALVSIGAAYLAGWQWWQPVDGYIWQRWVISISWLVFTIVGTLYQWFSTKKADVTRQYQHFAFATPEPKVIIVKHNEVIKESPVINIYGYEQGKNYIQTSMTVPIEQSPLLSQLDLSQNEQAYRQQVVLSSIPHESPPQPGAFFSPVNQGDLDYYPSAPPTDEEQEWNSNRFYS